MVQYMKNNDSHTFYCNFKTMVSTEIKLHILSFLEHFLSDPFNTSSEVALFFEKIRKVLKNKVGPGVQYSLRDHKWMAFAHYMP